jgi:periodic tryptophan protein 1
VLDADYSVAEDDEGSGSGEDEEEEEDEGKEDVDVEEEEDVEMKPAPKPKVSSDPNDLSAFKMDEYDQEESKGVGMLLVFRYDRLVDHQRWVRSPMLRGFHSTVTTMRTHTSLLRRWVCRSHDVTRSNVQDDEEAERQELELRPTDSMLITARTTADLSALDFHIYDEAEENLYVHHDLMLPSFPLCVEWLDFDPSSSSTPGNYVAVGSFDPTIEIWDADMVDGLYPQAILGPAPSLEKPELKPKGTGKKKRRQVVADPNYHLQPVLSLSWTPNHRHLLLSGSADATIKLWDLTRESPMAAVTSWDNVHGGEKVSAVEWNKSASGNGLDKAVLSAGYDRVVKVWDSRAVNEGIGIKVGSDVECVRWDPWEPTSFFVSLENGLVLAYDSRTLPTNAEPLKNGLGSLSTAQPKYTLSAHDGPASALDINPHIRGCIATGGMDKNVKIWNVLDEETEGIKGRKREISLVTSRDLGLVSRVPLCRCHRLFCGTTALINRAKSSPLVSAPIPKRPLHLLPPDQKRLCRSGMLPRMLVREKPSASDYDDMDENSARLRRAEESSGFRMRMMMSLMTNRHVFMFACIILRFTYTTRFYQSRSNTPNRSAAPQVISPSMSAFASRLS